MKSSSAMHLPMHKIKLARSHSDSNTASFAATTASANFHDYAQQLPPPPQLDSWFFRQGREGLISVTRMFSNCRRWIMKGINAFLVHIWEWKIMFFVLLAYLFYVYIPEIKVRHQSEDSLKLASGQPPPEWQMLFSVTIGKFTILGSWMTKAVKMSIANKEVRRCQHYLEALQQDYLALYNQTKSLQDTLEDLKGEIQMILQIAQDAANNAVKQAIEYQRSKGAVSKQQVIELVSDAMKKLQEDYISVADYALKSAGASIVRSKTSASYESDKAQMHWHNIALWNYLPNPDVILEPDVYPGNCWPFPGSQGQILVKLAESICPVAVTMQHIARAISPPGEITSAPKDFSIYGLNDETEEDGTFLGQFTYNMEGEPIQTFELPGGNDKLFKYILLKVLSNWGNSEYTCLYRFRVHRDLPSQTVEIPSQTVEKPSQTEEMPSQTVEKPSQTVEKPSQTVEKPSQTVEKPSQTVEKPSQTVEMPMNTEHK